MRALIVYCHPRPDSFTGAVRDTLQERLDLVEAEVRLIDLYADGFDPVLSDADLVHYTDPQKNTQAIAAYAADLTWADTLVFVYPTWWYGMPAVLKGWLDRVLVPGLAFHLPEQANGRLRPGLTQINRLAVFTTCGASWALTRWIGAPGQRTLLRGVRLLCAPRCKTCFAALYNIDASEHAGRTAYLARVARKMDRFLRRS